MLISGVYIRNWAIKHCYIKDVYIKDHLPNYVNFTYGYYIVAYS